MTSFRLSLCDFSLCSLCPLWFGFLYASSSLRTWPSRTMSMGRLPGAISFFRRRCRAVVDRHGQVLDRQRVVLGLGGRGVGRAVDEALLDAAAGQHHAEHLGPVVAAGVGVDLRRPAELRRNHDQRRIEQPAAVQVADQRGEGLVEAGNWPRHAVLDAAVHVPAAVGQRHEAHARRHQPPGHQHPLAGGVAAVLVAHGPALGVDVERLAGLLRADKAVGPLVERVHRLQAVGLFLARRSGR